MRPDKKKKVHHDSKKAKSRALASTNDASDKNSRSRQDTTNLPRTSKALEESDTPPKSDIASSSIQNENLNEINPEENTISQLEGKDYSKRTIESNWAKYDLPPSDSDQSESDELMTGLDFNYVIQNALKSDSMFRLKAEKEWEEKQTMFTDEIFSLNMANLEKAVSCVPLPDQLDISKAQFEENLFCPNGYKHLVEKARQNFDSWSAELKIGATEDIESVNGRLVSMLISKNSLEETLEKSSHSYDNESNQNFRKEQIGKVNNIKDSSVPSNPGINPADNNPISKQPQVDSELEQLLMVDSIQTKSSPVQNSSNPDDAQMAIKRDPEPNRDLNYKITNASPILLENPKTDNVDSDKNKGNETKNLEDWLDDFLSD